MAEKLVMPKLGLTMKTGKIVKWHVKEGDQVKSGQDIFDVENEKLMNTIQSPADGTLLKIVLPEGESASVLELVGIIGKPGEDISSVLNAACADSSAGSDNGSGSAANETGSRTAGSKAAGIKERITVTVIGGGPGGYTAAIRAAQLGGKVTLVEKEKIGGTCLNVGCIPTKAILHAASFKKAAEEAAGYGVDLSVRAVEWGKIIEKKNEIVSRLTRGVEGLLRAAGVTIVEGVGRLTADGNVKVVKSNGLEETINCDKTIIAAGSIPAIPPIPGVEENKNCIDSTGALLLEKRPESLLIIGGGVIGIELGSAFASFGTKVTIIEALPKLLPMMDGELTEKLKELLETEGMTINTSAKVLSIEDDPVGAKVYVEEDGKKLFYTAEKVLVAVGRRTNTAALALDDTGIVNDGGRIIVNDKMETSVPGIYAVGDCLGQIMLAHVAMQQADIAAENAMGMDSVYDGKTNPSCVYTSPEFAGVGLTEEQAQASGIDYRVGRFPLMANGKSLIMNGGVGTVKLLFGKDHGELIGAHILGPNATEIIAELSMAIGLESTDDEIIRTIHGHPTVSESVREAALASQGRAIHIPNNMG